MNKQRGFTLLEIILALVIFASCAMMVVSTIPSRSGADIFGQQLKALVEYGSDRAVMDGNIVGPPLNISWSPGPKKRASVTGNP